jgi:hypothetical protein
VTPPAAARWFVFIFFGALGALEAFAFAHVLQARDFGVPRGPFLITFGVFAGRISPAASLGSPISRGSTSRSKPASAGEAAQPEQSQDDQRERLGIAAARHAASPIPVIDDADGSGRRPCVARPIHSNNLDREIDWLLVVRGAVNPHEVEPPCVRHDGLVGEGQAAGRRASSHTNEVPELLGSRPVIRRGNHAEGQYAEVVAARGRFPAASG